MKKVVIAQKDLKAIRSGVARKVLSEVDLFRSLGYQVDLIAESMNRALLKECGASLHKSFKWPIKGYYRRKFFDRSAARKIAQLKPDLVIGHGNIIQQDICFLHNCVHLAHETIHGGPLPKDNDVGRIHAEILETQAFDVLVCNSHLMRKDLESRFGIKEKRIEVIYPCFDQRRFTKPDRSLREQLGIEDDVCIVGLVTSGDYTKRNVDFFLEAMSQFSSDHKVHVVVAGGKASERQEMLREACPHRVSFLPSTDRVADYYQLLDVFVLPAHIEEFGRSVLEAMYFSKPVIVHNMVGAAELLEGDAKRFILPRLAQSEFLDALGALVSDPILRQTMGGLNRNTALRYETSLQDKKLVNLVSELSD